MALKDETVSYTHQTCLYLRETALLVLFCMLLDREDGVLCVPVVHAHCWPSLQLHQHLPGPSHCWLPGDQHLQQLQQQQTVSGLLAKQVQMGVQEELAEHCPVVRRGHWLGNAH